MRFLVDMQLPPALCGWLAKRGHEAEHVSRALDVSTPDLDICEHARAAGAVVVSKDGDFVMPVRIAGSPQLLRVRLGNVVNARLFERLDAEWSRIEEELASGQLVVEIGRDKT